MGRRVWLAVALWGLALPAWAAEVDCRVADGVVTGTDADEVWVAIDDEVHVVRPTAEPDDPQSVESFCVARPGLVAIVLPAPKPGPDDHAEQDERTPPEAEPPLDALRGISVGDAVPGARGHDDEPSAAEGAQAQDDVSTAAEPAPTLARPAAESTQILHLTEDLADGCDATSGPAGGSPWALLVVALGLRRRRARRAR